MRAFLRGDQLILDGDDVPMEQARRVVDELEDAGRAGPRDRRADGRRRLRRAGRERPRRSTSCTTSSGATAARRSRPRRSTRSATSTRSARSTITFGIGPAGTGKTYLAMALAVAALVDREVSRIILTRPAVEAGERLGFLPGDLMAKVDPYLRPLFDALLDMLDSDRVPAVPGEGHRRGRAARLHARPHAERLVHHPRRGAEHDARADADVPDAARLRLEDGRHRRRHADRPAARPALRPRRGAARSCRASPTSRSCSSTARTSSATSSCSGSSTPTASTPSGGGDRAAEGVGRSRSTTARPSAPTRRALAARIVDRVLDDAGRERRRGRR